MAEQGDARAQAWLGHRYYWGAGGVARDRARALDYLQVRIKELYSKHKRVV